MLTLKKHSRAPRVDTHNCRATVPMHKSYHAYECVMSPSQDVHNFNTLEIQRDELKNTLKISDQASLPK